jgi:hypothetical protein
MIKNKKENWIEKRYYLTLISFILIVAGITFNYIALSSNECKMPVYHEDFKETYIKGNNLITNNREIINNFYYTDIFYIIIDNYLFFSIGDFISFIGIFIIVFVTIIDISKRIKVNNKNKRVLNNKRKNGK